MEPSKAVIEKLNELGIEFEMVEHEPAFTTEQADKFIEGIEGVRTKTMFLTDKKKKAWFLVIMDDDKRLDMKEFGEIVGAKGIKMTSEESLMEKLMLKPGMVSPFGLLNNIDHDVQIYFDEEIMGEDRMSFHPNTNEKTIFVKTPDIIRFLKSIGYEPQIIKL
ncbi:MAG: prolyl-tRNA synthetase associated domain-containing protein [Bacillota bacterium]|nr:prolyl-tRNA synthetase associated domain-containing protein [Bacillota bacterium]